MDVRADRGGDQAFSEGVRQRPIGGKVKQSTSEETKANHEPQCETAVREHEGVRVTRRVKRAVIEEEKKKTKAVTSSRWASHKSVEDGGRCLTAKKGEPISQR